MKYRDHRGSLKQSMKTVIEISSREELINHLNEKGFNRVVTDMKIEYSSHDARTGWDTYYVSVKLKGRKGFHYVGMSDGILK